MSRANRTFSALLPMTTALGLATPAAGQTAPGIDYRTAPFSSQRVVEWGTRPVWSFDGRRIAFTEVAAQDTYAFEYDLDRRIVRCVTCHLGMEGRVRRIYYLPDGNYLLLARRGLGRGRGFDGVSTRSGTLEQELYWMANKRGAVMQPLGATAFGDLGVVRAAAPGVARLAWGSATGGRSTLNVGTIRVTGGKPGIVDRKAIFDSATQPAPGTLTISEAYNFTADGRGVTFYSVVRERGTLNGEMFVADIATGRITKLYDTPAHNETHLFPDNRFGLEESNRASDPDGKWRGISTHPASIRGLYDRYPGVKLPSDLELRSYVSTNGQRGFDRPFDLYVVTLDGSAPPRRLTDHSGTGTNTDQSSIAPDGLRIAYAIDPRGSDEMAGKQGIYIGTFAGR